jgi:hypothetical protein
MAADAEEARSPIGFGRQPGYAFIGLLAGNAAIAAVLLSVGLAAFLHSRCPPQPQLLPLTRDPQALYPAPCTL